MFLRTRAELRPNRRRAVSSAGLDFGEIGPIGAGGTILGVLAASVVVFTPVKAATRNPARDLALAIVVIGALPILLSDVLPMSVQPYSDAAQYLDAAENLAEGRGYYIDTTRPFVEEAPAYVKGPGDLARPTYPPGLSLVLVPFELAGAVHLGPPAIAAALYFAIVALAWRLGGPVAGAIGAVMAGTAPFILSSARLFMSDTLGALLAVLVVLGAVSARPRLMGLAAGFGVLVRLSNVTTLVAALIFMRSRRRVALCAAPCVGVLLLYQWLAFGVPFSSGYQGDAEFVVEYVWQADMHGDCCFYATVRPPGVDLPRDITGIGLPNPVMYLATVGGAWWLFAPPLLPLFGFLELWHRRRSELGRVAGAVILANILLVLPYYFQSARLVAPAAAVMTAFAAAGIARVVRSLSHVSPAISSDSVAWPSTSCRGHHRAGASGQRASEN